MYLCSLKKMIIHKNKIIMKKIFTLFAAMLVAAFSYAQLPDASIAPDFSLYEINKTTGEMQSDHTISLYGMLNDYKTVFMDVSATTCSPCYSFHQSGTLESIYNNYGPNSTVNDSRVLFIEGAQTGNSWAAINGSAGSGYWDCTHVYGSSTQLVPYPVIPLCLSPNYPSNYNSFHSGYNIHYFPTMYMVCPNRLVFNLDNSSSNVSTQYHDYSLSVCPEINHQNDAYIVPGTYSDGAYFCEYSFTPVITIQNVGSTNMTSATFRLTHGSDVQDIPWTGNLAQYEKTQVTLAPVTGTESGSQTFQVEVVNVNGVADEGSVRNIHTETYSAQVSSEIFSASQNFSNASSLDPWLLLDQSDGYCFIYQGALIFNAYSASSGKKAELYAPLMNFSNVSEPKISFDLCYKRYNNNSNDKLQIMVSADCGDTWTAVFDKSGASLATGANTTNNYVPSASEYQTQTVDLADFVSNERVIIKFVFTSKYGNNIWIDNVNIFDGPVSVEEIHENGSLAFFPNPVKDVLNINYDKAVNQIDVYDVNGKLVKTFTTVNGSINVSDLSDGVYMLNIQTEEGLVIRKIVKE